ncbi:hypothetical protein, partial [Natronococcus sp.]|uniref:hypothetical protein n=1 Tax=Natronococcus sp. TaxID=35747 RepID=UPI0025EA3B84
MASGRTLDCRPSEPTPRPKSTAAVRRRRSDAARRRPEREPPRSRTDRRGRPPSPRGTDSRLDRAAATRDRRRRRSLHFTAQFCEAFREVGLAADVPHSRIDRRVDRRQRSLECLVGRARREDPRDPEKRCRRGVRLDGRKQRQRVAGLVQRRESLEDVGGRYPAVDRERGRRPVVLEEGRRLRETDGVTGSLELCRDLLAERTRETERNLAEFVRVGRTRLRFGVRLAVDRDHRLGIRRLEGVCRERRHVARARDDLLDGFALFRLERAERLVEQQLRVCLNRGELPPKLVGESRRFVLPYVHS